jgi:hypothetical protein
VERIGAAGYSTNDGGVSSNDVDLIPAFGSSEFAICATQLVNGKIQVIYADSYDKADFTDMISEV